MQQMANTFMPLYQQKCQEVHMYVVNVKKNTTINKLQSGQKTWSDDKKHLTYVCMYIVWWKT